jgi:hypothetical protein
MARIGISITKSTAFRNSTQEFSNVYYFQVAGSSYPTGTQADSLIDELTTLEKGWHSTLVTFVRGRCWKQAGSPSENEMISQKNLSGTGSTSSGTYDKERAFLVRLRAGNDSRGNPVYLRKWYHSCGNGPGGVVPSGNVLQNTTGFSTTERDNIKNAVNPIRNIGAAIGGWQLCAKSGRDYGVGLEFNAHQFLEHHQFGDQWRAQ